MYMLFRIFFYSALMVAIFFVTLQMPQRALATSMCVQPKIPVKFETIWQLDAFTKDAAEYRGCVEQYIQRIKEAAHKKNALVDDSVYAQQKAIDEFNAFSDTATQRIMHSNIPYLDAID